MRARHRGGQEGKAYVTGKTQLHRLSDHRSAFDTTLNGSEDAFVTKLNASGSALAYSTFLGGRSQDRARASRCKRAGPT